MPDHFQVGGFILRDGAEPVIGPRFARTRWRLLTMRSNTLMVRSAATPRVSNHEAAWYAFTISSRADWA